MCNILVVIVCTCQLLWPMTMGSDEKTFATGNRFDFAKGKRGVAGVVDSVQSVHGQHIHGGVGAHLVPVAVPIHVPVPRPYPVGVPKPIGVPVGVPVAVRIPVPKPYPIPVFVDPAATSGLEYGLGSYGHGLTYTELDHLLNYLTKSTHGHNHVGHDRHSLANYALSKLIH